MKAFVFVQRSFGFAIRKETETGDYKSPVTKAFASSFGFAIRKLFLSGFKILS